MFSEITPDGFKLYLVFVVFILNFIFLGLTLWILTISTDENNPLVHTNLFKINLIQMDGNQFDPYLNSSLQFFGNFNGSWVIVAYIGFSFLAGISIWRHYESLCFKKPNRSWVILFYICNTFKYGIFSLLLCMSAHVSDPKMMTLLTVSITSTIAHIMFHNDTYSNHSSGLENKHDFGWNLIVCSILFSFTTVSTISYASQQQLQAFSCDIGSTVVSLLIFGSMLGLENIRIKREKRKIVIQTYVELKNLKKRRPATPREDFMRNVREKALGVISRISFWDIIIYIGILDSAYTAVSVGYAISTKFGACGLTT